MQIDPGSHVPIYQQIIDGIRNAIAAGVYRPGEMLPSQRELAVRIQVNPNTVHRAYEALEREGLVHSRRGLGMFVTNRAGRHALTGAEGLIRQALKDAVDRGRRVGLADEDLRALFDRVLRSAAAVRGASR